MTKNNYDDGINTNYKKTLLLIKINYKKCYNKCIGKPVLSLIIFRYTFIPKNNTTNYYFNKHLYIIFLL